MQVAHLGVAVFIVGVTMVTGYPAGAGRADEARRHCAGGGYEFKFNGATNVTGPNYVAARAEVIVSRNGKEIERMYPEKRDYTASGKRDD